MRGDWFVDVVRLRQTPAGVDVYGELIPGEWARQDLPRALFAPGVSIEPVSANAMPVVTSPSLYWRGTRPDIRATDRIEVLGTVYEVEGRPQAWPKGLVIHLRTVRES